MSVMQTHISWTDSTWNPSSGCSKVSAGCDHCYAERLTNRLFGGGFETVRTHPDRLRQVRRFGPVLEDGSPRPRLVFVNSMSDLMHEDVPDRFRHDVADAIETMPYTAFQILTKRPMTMRRFVEERWKGKGVPVNVWLGVSVEDDRVRGRIDQLRRLKDSVGAFTAFLSVEPLIGEPTRHDYVGIDWVLIGGESGPDARDCRAPWVRLAIELAERAGAAVHFKQWGAWRNNPLYQQANARTHGERVRHAIRAGELLPSEKGGATLDGATYRERPASYQALGAALHQATKGAPGRASAGAPTYPRR